VFHIIVDTLYIPPTPSEPAEPLTLLSILFKNIFSKINGTPWNKRKPPNDGRGRKPGRPFGLGKRQPKTVHPTKHHKYR
jgi:hypothetical protein